MLLFFDNGRVEAFLHCKTLTPEEMAAPRYVPAIAAKLRQLHATDMGPGWPRSDTLWPTICGWLDLAAALVFDDPAKASKFAQVVSSKAFTAACVLKYARAALAQCLAVCLLMCSHVFPLAGGLSGGAAGGQ